MPLRSEARRWTWVESAVLAGYAIVVALGIAWHEPWADEAQAWLLARDQGFWRLMLHAVRYEGSPGLWHALLWVLARLHFGYIGMHWVAGAFAAAGVFVLLRWSPFPLILRVLLPFGFWLAYQNAVIARGYVLFALLAFSAAALIRNMSANNLRPMPDGKDSARSSTLIWLAVILGLMTNLSVHGFVASFGFAIAVWPVLRRRTRAGSPVRKTTPALILGSFWLFAVATTLPPSDVNLAAGKNLERSTEKIWASFGDKYAKSQLAADHTGGVVDGRDSLSRYRARAGRRCAARRGLRRRAGRQWRAGAGDRQGDSRAGARRLRSDRRAGARLPASTGRPAAGLDRPSALGADGAGFHLDIHGAAPRWNVVGGARRLAVADLA